MAAPLTRDFMKKELVACAEDPIYFLKSYAKIIHPTRGKIPFETFPFQDDCIGAFLEHRFNIILKARQLGLSTVTAGFSVWYALFNKDKSVLVIATKLEVAQNFIKKVKMILDTLPEWWKGVFKIVGETKKSVTLSNGSTITAIPTSEDAGRSEALSLLIVDEAAIIDNFEEIWTGLFPTVSAGGRVILLSTPKGASGQFYDLWQQAVTNELDFNPITLPWYVHPEHDEAWFKKETKALSPRKIAQEYLCVAEGTRIVTESGYKNIEDIKLGDKVLTHKGRFRPVIKIHDRLVEDDEKLFSISSPGSRKRQVILTGNHPVLCYRFSASSRENSYDILHQKNVQSSWITAETLASSRKTTDRILGALFPKFDRSEITGEYGKILDLAAFYPSTEISDTTCRYKRQWGHTKRFVDIDYDLGKFVGLYLAEGCKGHCGGLDLGFHIDEYETHRFWVEKFLVNLNCRVKSEKAKKSKACRVWTYNKHLGALVRHFVSGNVAHEKLLNWSAVMATNIEFIRGLLDGHYLGDGNHGHTKKFSVFSTSSQLIYQLRTLYSLFSLYPRIGHTPYSEKNSKHHDMWYLEFYADGKSYEELISSGQVRKPGTRVVQYDNFFVGTHRFTDRTDLIEIDGGIRVYDLKVDEDSSFVAESTILHNCDFNTSGETFLQSEDIDYLRSLVKPPIDKWGNDRNLWVWETPVPGASYIISADVSRGNATDYSTMHVIKDGTAEVVAEYMGKLPPDEFGKLLHDVGRKYNDALICPENNTFGYSAIRTLKLFGYQNLYYEGKKRGYVPIHEMDLAGFSTQKNSREKILTNFERLVRQKKIRSYSERLVLELKTFVVIGSKARAQDGKHDDLIMSLAIGAWLIDPDASPDDNDDYTRALLGAMSSDRRNVDSILGSPNSVKPMTTQGMTSGFRPDPIESIEKKRTLTDQIKRLQQTGLRDPNDFSWVIK